MNLNTSQKNNTLLPFFHEALHKALHKALHEALEDSS